MIDKDTLLLQNCVELPELVPSSSREAHLTSDDGNEIINLKIEEEEPVRITFPVMKAEPEVSCLSVCLLLGIFLKYLKLPAFG
jgi:hypothetical protein